MNAHNAAGLQEFTHSAPKPLTHTPHPNYELTVFPGFMEPRYTGEGKGDLAPPINLKSGNKDTLSLFEQNRSVILRKANNGFK